MSLIIFLTIGITLAIVIGIWMVKTVLDILYKLIPVVIIGMVVLVFVWYHFHPDQLINSTPVPTSTSSN